MERPRTPRRRPEAPTTLHEITRRYVATALALARSLGLPWTEDFLRQHRESITTCFIEAGRVGVRLPSAVQLPPLSAPSVASVNGEVPETDVREEVPEASPPSHGQAGEIICTMTPDPALETPPTMVPKDAGLPCAGQVIADLKPAALAMIIAKVATLVHAEGERWVPLLGALQVERVRRLERGRKPRRPGSEEKE